MTFQQLFGIEIPIIQAPMAGSQGSAGSKVVLSGRRDAEGEKTAKLNRSSRYFSWL